MNLDEHQLQEFDAHWQNSFVKVGRDKIGKVIGIKSRTAAAVEIFEPTGKGKPLDIPISDIEFLGLPVGFYNYGKRLEMFYRSPRQGRIKGLHNSNASFGFCYIDNKEELVCEDVGLDSPRVMAAVAQAGKKDKKKEFDNWIADIADMSVGKSSGVALGRSYGLVVSSKKKRTIDEPGYGIYLCNHGGKVGKVSLTTGAISIPATLSYILPSLQEEFESAYTPNFKDIVNVRG